MNEVGQLGTKRARKALPRLDYYCNFSESLAGDIPEPKSLCYS